MLSTGVVTIDGKQYTWISPSLADLEHFEAMVGGIMKPEIVNSVKGRVWLCYLCLRKQQPDLTPKLIADWPAEAWHPMWDVIRQALPLWGPPEGGEAAASSETSPPPSSGSPDGLPAAPGASE